MRTFWADSPKSLAICSAAAMSLGGSGCTVWLSTTFVNGGTATASTPTTTIQAAITSHGARTTKRPSTDKESMPVEGWEEPDWLATVNPSFVWSSEGRERGHPLVVDGTLTARG